VTKAFQVVYEDQTLETSYGSGGWEHFIIVSSMLILASKPGEMIVVY